MNLFKELQRRNVYRVAIAYVVTAWLLAQVADLGLGAFGAPPWVQKTLLFLLALGFPVACLLAWAYELTPQGIKRSTDSTPSAESTVGGHRTLDLVIISLLTVAVVGLLADRFVVSGGEDPTPAAAGSARPSVAILPFINRSPVETDAFFVDGVHEDLLRQIATIGSIKTISRTSVLQYRDSVKSAPDIAAELGVDTILEGGVQRAGEDVRINVQLIDAGTDEYLWTASYEKELSAENIFAIQSEIATAVAGALRAALSPQERDHLAKVPTTDFDALNLYFSGRRRMESRRPDELEIAVREFEEAVALDPSFALAYVALADTYRLLNNYGDLPQDTADARGRDAVEKALALDDRLGAAYASLANLRHRSGDNEGAERAFLRGIELNPNYAPLYQWYGEFLVYNVWRPEEAIVVASKAVALDPKSAIINRDYAEVLHAAGRLEEAMAHYRIASELAPDSPFAFEGEALLVRLGPSGPLAAIRAFEALTVTRPDNPWSLFAIATSFLDLRDPERAATYVERIENIAPGSEAHRWALLLLELYRGNQQQAVQLSEQLRQTWPNHALALRILRDEDIDRDKAGDARTRYTEQFPKLRQLDKRNVHPFDVDPMVDFACLLQGMGEVDLAASILDASLEQMSAMPRLGRMGYNVTDVKALTLLGDRAGALAALRDAYDDGWRLDWWLELERDRCLGDLRDEPGFKAVVELIRADMRRQRATLDDASL